MNLSLHRPPRRVLGVTLGPVALRVAEVAMQGETSVILRHGAIPLTAELTCEKPEALGAALKALLEAKGFKARRAIVGLPAHWLVQRSHPVPPADATTTASLLRLAMEREFGGEAGQWVFDAPLEVTGSRESAANVLMLGAQASRLSQIRTLAQAAGLRLAGMTATAAAMMQRRPMGSGDAAMLLLDGGSAELALGHETRLAGIEQFGGSADAMHAALRRALTVAGLRLKLRPKSLDVWSNGGEGGVAGDLLPDLVVRSAPSPESLGLRAADPVPGGDLAMAAAAVAAAGLGRVPLAIDFLHPRLAAPKPRRLTRSRIFTGVGVVAALLAVAAFAWDWRSQQQAVDELRAAIDAMRDDVATATEQVARRRLASGWYEARPPFLDAMHALTELVADAGSVWATSLTFRDDMSAALAGKAAGERDVLALLEALKASNHFHQVRLQYIRQEDRSGGTVVFALAFALADQEPVL